MSNKSKIAIIGAGITGLYAAYWLEQFADVEITIFETHKIAHGASGKNAGFVTAGSPHHFFHLIDQLGEQQALKIWNFSKQSVEMTKKLIKELAVPLREEGSIGVIESPEDEKLFQKFYEYSQKHSLNAQWVEDSLFGKSLTIPSDGSVMVKDVLRQLSTQLKRTKFVYEEVISLEQNKLTTQNNSYSFDHCLCATNNNLIANVFDIQTTPQRAQIQRLKLAGDLSKITYKNYYMAKSRVYFRRVSQDEIIIGGLRLIDPENEQTTVMEANPKIQKALTEKAGEIFQKDMELVHSWSGIMAFTPMELPVYEQKDSLHFIGGFSGHGNGLAMLAAHNWAQNIALSTGNNVFSWSL
jgi:gamma-glutamylputrescine oxidase